MNNRFVDGLILDKEAKALMEYFGNRKLSVIECIMLCNNFVANHNSLTTIEVLEENYGIKKLKEAE